MSTRHVGFQYAATIITGGILIKLPKFSALYLASVCAGPLAAASPAPDGARAYIVSPAHDEVVGTRFKVVLDLSGIGVAPAGIAPEQSFMKKAP